MTEQRGTLRFTTAGSVDDGKSTLIGRLLYDTDSLADDQLSAVRRASRRLGDSGLNLALVTDGLRAEREQNITIDVAHRYFATRKRKFIIADTPGHAQYTRNMVTGASTAELAIVLVDARKGIQTQSRRHTYIAHLLGIPNLVVLINKMDLVEYDQERFNDLATAFRRFTAAMRFRDVICIPASALQGDNVVRRGSRLPWYHGPTLLEHLENVPLSQRPEDAPLRFPVQYIVRPHQDFRGIAGRILSGRLAVGDEVLILPHLESARVRSILGTGGLTELAQAGDSVVVTLDRDLDVSRGMMLASPGSPPLAANELDAELCWMDSEPLQRDRSYVMMHTTRETRATVYQLVHRLDVDTLTEARSDAVAMNEIARVRVRTASPVLCDGYSVNRGTGSFVLIDPSTNATVAAGMIRTAFSTGTSGDEGSGAAQIAWEGWNIPRSERELRSNHRGAVIWFTGLPGSGKSTLARALERRLFESGVRTVLLDGDQLRRGLNRDLGFSEGDRRENVRRTGEVAALLFEHGTLVICALVSPYRAERDTLRARLPEERFMEVHVDAGAAVVARRDPKGLYAMARAGVLHGLTGVDAPYEAPESPELQLHTESEDVDACAEKLMALLQTMRIVE